ncbi:MAG: class I SAM-dependent methyltransferase [Isosphaeraceae bacterium]
MITTWTSGASGEHMPSSILLELAPIVRRHPWWLARSALVLDLLARHGLSSRGRVLDAGCGWGTTLLALERAGFAATGLDVVRPLLARLDGERSGRDLIEADLTQDWPEAARPALGTFDAVLALDVIEHLDDDRAAVSRLAALARPGGLVVVSVPALPELFSEFDSVQGHRRRYSPETLRDAFAGSGLDVARVSWWGAWMVPILARRRSKRRGIPGEPAESVYRKYLRLPPWPAPWALRLAFALERRRALADRLTTGTSLFALARRTC